MKLGLLDPLAHKEIQDPLDRREIPGHKGIQAPKDRRDPSD